MSAAKRTRTWSRLAVLLLLAAGSAFAVWHIRRAHGATDLPASQAHRGEFLVRVPCRGQLIAARSVQLSAPLDVADLQIIWLAPSGSDVKEGMTVIRFDPSRVRQDRKEKKAALEQAQATLDQAVAQARITADQDKLDLAKTRYDAEKARLEASKAAIISAMDGEKSKIDLGLAEEKVKVQQATAELHKKSNEAKIASSKRLRDEAQADVARAERRLAQLDVKSPLNGVVTYLANRTQGWMNSQPFKVGDHVSAGLAVAEIPDLSTLQMESKVDEVDRGRIALGDTVLVHVDAFPEKVLNAKLVSISPLTEQAFTEWPPTRSFKAYARLSAPDKRLRPGMNAGADIIQERIPDALSIPAKALFTFHGKPTVYVKTNGRYLPVQVSVRARNTDEIAVEGIKADQFVALAEPEQVNR
ncbi:MAG: efflux RND transporter periplasmic adaptor subunit [Acidobacteriaceae bacterium]|nr:efflux RND transporter periplasmic adaptor subunit [Acidobacteriaceae bacterium]MBV9498993.1 efflux RND transporter periplasmic adaptor subunit [Acidobacteriaceae bacterium]